jgi:catechol 2,3-dioxygenase-like lactoylglutathione lyase family enzyme
MRFLYLPLLAFALYGAEPLPILGIAHGAFKVSNLDKARAFYTGVLGYQEAFAIKDESGAVTMAFFKINDDQYIEISPGLKPDENDRMTHLALLTSDIEKLHRALNDLGLSPTAIKPGRDGNRNFSVRDPDGHRLEFVQYMPGSWHTNARGKFMDSRRISTELRHIGISVKNLDAAMAFYRDKLGFQETWRGGPTDAELRWVNMRMPGPRGDYIEFMLHDKPPTRAQLGSMHHLCLEVPEIQAPYRTLLERGIPAEERYKPRIGRNRKWLLNLFDPDGSRTELMEPKTVD